LALAGCAGNQSARENFTPPDALTNATGSISNLPKYFDNDPSPQEKPSGDFVPIASSAPQDTAALVSGPYQLDTNAKTNDPSVPPPDEEADNGENFGRPQRRMEWHLDYEHLKPGTEEYFETVRWERPFILSDDWKLGLRVDLPAYISNKKTADNPDAAYTSGLGDVLTQIALIKTISDRMSVAAGSQFIFPSATQDQFGDGKYRAVPSAELRFKLPEISSGSYFAPLVRYDGNFAGPLNRSDISTFEIGPELNIRLPGKFYIDFYPSQDIRYNFLTNKWFVPVDIQVGRKLTDRFIWSVEASYGLIKAYQLYDFKLEFRIGFFY
jgi:hypothetical protein